MSRRATIPDLPPLPADESDRLDALFASIEPDNHPARIIALPDAPEMASDLWELARLRDQYRG